MGPDTHADLWSSVRLARDRTNARTLSWLAAALVPAWIPFDLLLAPAHWPAFAAIRAALVAAAIGVAAAVERARSPTEVNGLISALVVALAVALGWMARHSGGANLYYVAGSTVVPWAVGLGMLWPARWMAPLQLAVLVGILAGLPPDRPAETMLAVTYYLTAAALCTVLSAIRLDGLRQLFDARQQLLHVQVGAAEERAANLAKSAFLARMSHELRTPLSTILGYTELVEEQLAEVGVRLVDDDLDRVSRAARHLLTLIDDVLDLSRIEAGELRVERRAVELGALLADAASEVRPVLEARGVELALELPADLGTLTTDPARVRQIVLNLLTNAAKFTPRGRVTVRARRSDDGVRIEVEDTGLGVPPDAVERLFEPFFQVDPSFTRRRDGTGLGLAIVRELASLLGGRVHVRSTPGVGSTFSLDLPAAA